MESTRFLGWNKVGNTSIVVLFTILSIMYVFIFMNLEISKTEYIKYLRTWLYKCHVECEKDDNTCENINNNRGNNYGYDPNIDGKYRDYKNCVLTGWEYSHFIFHVFLGIFYNIYISQSLSVAFEIYECLEEDCGSLNDLVLNFAGYCTGYTIRSIASKIVHTS